MTQLVISDWPFKVSVANNPNNLYDIMDLVYLKEYTVKVNCVYRADAGK